VELRNRAPISAKRLTEAIHDGTLGLPDFQRPSVWSPKQQIKLLESLREDLPIGVLIVSQFQGRPRHETQRPFFFGSGSPPFKYLVLDGQQRLRALSAMCRGPDPNDHSQTTLVISRDGRVSARKQRRQDREDDELFPVSSSITAGTHRPRGMPTAQWNMIQDVKAALNRDCIHLLVADLRDHAQAVELFERINSRGSRLAQKDLVAARLAEFDPAYITNCEAIANELMGTDRANRVRCFDRMVITKSVSFAATGNQTSKAKATHEKLFAILHPRPQEESTRRKPNVKRHLSDTRRAGKRLREEISGVFGLAGHRIDGLLDGNAALVAMQFFIAHRRPTAQELATFRRWLFVTMFSSYYTGGGTESKVDEDLALISARRPNWRVLFQHAQEGARQRGVVHACTPRRVELNRDPQWYARPRVRNFLEALRRFTIANRRLAGWINEARTVQIGDEAATVQHILPRRPAGSRRWRLGKEVVEHPANFATIHGNDNTILQNQQPHEYLPKVPRRARNQQLVPDAKFWKSTAWGSFLKRRTIMIVAAAERRVNSNAWIPRA
jgi:hypothetical protein